MTPSHFSAAVSDKYRAKFVTSVVKYAQAFGFDGIDFDFEYPGYEHGAEPMPGQPKRGDAEDIADCAKAGSGCQRKERALDGANFGKVRGTVRSPTRTARARSRR